MWGEGAWWVSECGLQHTVRERRREGVLLGVLLGRPTAAATSTLCTAAGALLHGGGVLIKGWDHAPWRRFAAPRAELYHAACK